MAKEILWIGSFLSAVRGSKGVSETLFENLEIEGYEGTLASKFEHKVFRLIDIIWASLFTSAHIVHIDVFSGAAFKIAEIASQIAKYRNQKIVMTLHGGKLVEYATLHGDKINRVFKRANVIQTPSKFIQTYFLKEGFQVDYMPNSVQLNKFPFKRNEIKPNTLLWVRGFMSVYNPLLAIQILHEVKQVIPEATLTMIGPDKGLMESAKQLAKELHIINDILFLGAIPNNELYQFYQTHSVYINTTSYESFGVALVEAASCGIPIVSTAVGEIPLLWSHKKNVLLVDSFESKVFAKHVIDLLQNERDANDISRNANEHIQQFDWKIIKNQWLALLDKVSHT
jgi:L-malate glycosyltransferase